jgi:putative membrane protein
VSQNEREMPALSAAEFVQQAAMSDMFEIQSSELATRRAEGEYAQFAALMDNHHQKTYSELGQLVKPHIDATPTPPKLDEEHQKMLDKLNLLYGVAFAQEYRLQQINAHAAAVILFERFSMNGDDGELKAWATKVLASLREHLKMAQLLKS